MHNKTPKKQTKQKQTKTKKTIPWSHYGLTYVVLFLSGQQQIAKCAKNGTDSFLNTNSSKLKIQMFYLLYRTFCERKTPQY